MLKKIIIISLIVILIFNLVGCSEKVELPDGVEHEEFYKDMIKCLDLTKKALRNKNMKYVNDIKQIVLNYSSDAEKPKSTLNKKEEEIRGEMLILSTTLGAYLKSYFEDSVLNTRDDIKKDIPDNPLLIKQIQKVISVMEIEYDMGINKQD